MMDAATRDSGADRVPEPVARAQHINRLRRAPRLTLARGPAPAADAWPVTDAAENASGAEPPVIRSDLLTGAPAERLNRALNIVLAAGALLVLSPILLLIALAVKLTSRGPILYAQVRIGVDRRARIERGDLVDRRSGDERRRGLDRRGRPADRRATASRRTRHARAALGRRTVDVGGRAFRIYKFRSMCMDAECASGAVWATRNDPRVTPIGGILRHFRLDELPQLYNVLKGDMNIVGPRPERPSIFCRLREEIPEYSLRQRARPGITGWAQIRHSYDACLEDVRKKVRFDLEYLQRRNLWVDLKIMACTIPVMLFKRGAC
jgi:lipopolysaccharide/colanic/teichoic acid biosynthesis glycosyltransferase